MKPCLPQTPLVDFHTRARTNSFEKVFCMFDSCQKTLGLVSFVTGLLGGIITSGLITRTFGVLLDQISQPSDYSILELQNSQNLLVIQLISLTTRNPVQFLRVSIRNQEPFVSQIVREPANLIRDKVHFQMTLINCSEKTRSLCVEVENLGGWSGG